MRNETRVGDGDRGNGRNKERGKEMEGRGSEGRVERRRWGREDRLTEKYRD